MKSPAGDGAFFVVVAALLVVVSTSTVVLTDAKETAPDGVKWVCGQVYERASCLDVFLREPKTRNANDLASLTNLALDLAMANATKCVEAVKQLHAKPELPAALHPVLDFCAGRFGYSAKQFMMAKADIKGGSAEAAYYDTWHAWEGPQDCDRKMAEKNVSDEEIAALGMNIRLFVHIGQVVTKAYWTSITLNHP